MANKIFRSSMLVAALVLLASFGIIMGVLYDYFGAMQSKQLQDELSLAITGTEQKGKAYLQNLEEGRFRLTWVDAEGTVLYDTQAEESAMETHADREEIREALETGRGSSVRYSATFMEKTIYEARRLEDGTVLRISAASVTSAMLVLGMLRPVCVVIFIAILVSMVFSHQMAKRIVQPLNGLDLEKPLENEVYEEITPLLQRIHRQNLQIAGNMQKLRRKADEFTQITESLSEGLVLLDKNGLILSINPAAKHLFGAEDGCVGKDFLTVDPELRQQVNSAYLQGKSGCTANRGGRIYQFELSRLESDGAVIGMAILAFDITEQVNSERNRREFSANVSHELKTPLQSIIGSAELLEGGMVKPEDVPRFVGHIRRESARLISLIEDIIRLSQMDEGAALSTEEVDLYALAKETAATLQAVADSHHVELRVLGEVRCVQGVRRLLYEIIYNLCDNAIKYNVPGGRVELTVFQEKYGTKLTVSDTGIGIPAEHKDKIFERFYRVDKSHSKQSGGTGLGLSIVKHAVLLHKAKMEVQSTVGKGTIITVLFP